MNMTTIFITSFNPFIGRNILSTDVLGVLRKEDDLRIAVFVPDYKTAYFKEQYASLSFPPQTRHSRPRSVIPAKAGIYTK